MQLSYFRALAEIENLDLALDMIQAEAENAGFNKTGFLKIRLACEEILVNIIRYAYPQAKGEFEVKAESFTEPKGIRIEIKDTGIPFDPMQKLHPETLSLPLEKRPVGGLGIHLVSMVMDEIQYKREGDSNRLVMIKYLEIQKSS